MNALQWALLLLGIGAIVALIVTSRRERRALTRGPDPLPGADGEAGGRQRDAAAQAAFDEYGVSKPRRRGAAEPPAPARPEPTIAATPKPAPAPRAAAPGLFDATAASAPRQQPEKVVAGKPVPEKIITLFIAEHEGTKILGGRIHTALTAQGLQYNERNKAYDRTIDGKAAYSITSLTAPGHLDPGEAAAFSTPGLALFLRLPGPARPSQAFRDMLATADALAKALKAVLFDVDHKPLTEDTLQRLASEIDDWARRNA